MAKSLSARCRAGCVRLNWMLVAALFLGGASCALGADVRPGWGSWWLPPDRSAHGYQIDALFTAIFWITTVTFVGVNILLVYFLIKYRHRPDRKKGIFSHGNTRLEMAWTLAPAVILALLALFSKRVWDNYRYSPTANDPNGAKVLVIGERFKWNIIYPGPDGEFGRYLMYPVPYDAKWPDGSNFQNVPGPASLPYKSALAAIKAYNLQGPNHLGKDLNDPLGKDDIWQSAQGREMLIPVNRPIEVQLGSKDVLHDFFLPNFRVKLDNVPGMRGRIFFTATMTSSQFEDEKRQTVSLSQLAEIFKTPQAEDLIIRINEAAAGTEQNKNKDRTGWRYINPSDSKKASIIRDGQGFPKERRDDILKKLKDAGIEQVTVVPGPWEIVCEELCGEGHGTMRGQLRVLSGEDYDALKLDRPAGGEPTTRPSIAMNAAK